MSNILSQITQALVARVAVPNGAGAYTVNLSTAGRVLVAARAPDVQPGATVQFEQCSESESEELGNYQREAQWRVLVAVPSTDDDPQTQLLAVLDAVDDICRAIRLDRFLGNLVIWSRMESTTVLAGQELGASSPVPLGSITYMARWWEDSP